jgi:hypothetical protein
MWAIPSQEIGPLVVGTFNHHLTFANVFVFYASVLTALGIFYWKKSKAYLGLGFWLYLLCFWTDSRTAWIAIPFTARANVPFDPTYGESQSPFLAMAMEPSSVARMKSKN